jgi:hypothetical protein
MPNGTAVATHMIVVHLKMKIISRISFAAPDIELAAPDIELAAPDIEPDIELAAQDIELAAPDIELAAPDIALEVFLKSFPNSVATTSNFSSACVEKAVKNTISLWSLPVRIIMKTDFPLGAIFRFEVSFI